MELVRTFFEEMKAELLQMVSASRGYNPITASFAPVKGDVIDLVETERERELQILLNHQKEKDQYQLIKALVKMQRGTFGICEDCDQSIDEARLRARPQAEHCLQCEQAQESIQRGTSGGVFLWARQA